MRRLAGAEDGFTIVFALVLLFVGIGVGAAALADTLATRSHANLDTRQRRALQAADFGIQEVLYRVNQLNLDSLDLNGGPGKIGAQPVCVVHKSNGEWATENPTNGVCPKVEQEIGNHDSYQAEFIPNEKVPTGGSGISFIEPKIVSIGIDDNGHNEVNGKGEYLDPNHKVYARVDAGLSPVEPFKTVEANHNLTFRVPLAETFNGTARAGHQVYFKGEGGFANLFTGLNIKLGGALIGTPTIEYGCSPVEYEKGIFGAPNVIVAGVALEAVKEGSCESAYFKRPPIAISGSKANCTSGCAGLTDWESAGDNIKIVGKETLTLTAGNDYVFCSLWTNGPITLAAGTTNESLPVRVFIDNGSSSRCKGFTPYTAPNGEKVEAGSFYAEKGVGGFVGGFEQVLSPSQVQLYLTGNGTNNGTKFFSTTSGVKGNAFFLYAPQSEVSVSAPIFAGTLLGYDTTIKATLYTQDLGLNNYPLTSSYGVFHIAGYAQCSQTLIELKSNAVTDTAGC